MGHYFLDIQYIGVRFVVWQKRLFLYRYFDIWTENKLPPGSLVKTNPEEPPPSWTNNLHAPVTNVLILCYVQFCWTSFPNIYNYYDFTYPKLPNVFSELLISFYVILIYEFIYFIYTFILFKHVCISLQFFKLRNQFFLAFRFVQ